MNNESRATVGELFKWLVSIAVVHLLAAIVYAMTIGGIVMENIDNEKFMEAYNLIFYFGMAVLVLFAIYHTTMCCRDVDVKNDIKAYMKEKNFTLLGYFKDRCLKMMIYRLIVFIVWHIPLVVMYIVMNMGLVIYTLIGKLWIVEAGSMAVTGSIVLGILINVLVLGVAYVLSLLIGIHSLHKDIKENSFT